MTICRQEGCGREIQEATAKRTGGYCGPCAGRIAAAEREAYIRANRRTVDPYAGVTDPVEIVRLMTMWRRPDPLIEYVKPARNLDEMVRVLSPEDVGRLVEMAAEFLRGADEDLQAQGETMARAVATMTDGSLEGVQLALLNAGKAYPGIVFRGASPTVRDALIEGIERKEFERVDHAVEALAWIGDEVVRAALTRWANESPEWAGGFHIGIEDYARVGGWEIAGGIRRELTLPTCWTIEVAEEGEAASEGVRVMEPAGQACPWCGRELVYLLAIEQGAIREMGMEETLLGIYGKSEGWRVLTCWVCACYTLDGELGGGLIAERGADGEMRVSEAGGKPSVVVEREEGEGANSWTGKRVKLSRRGMLGGADWMSGDGTMSQVGGVPGWVQDLGYVKCPRCEQTMLCVGQVDMGSFSGEEGMYYAMACSRCPVTATTYQQT